VLNKASGLFFSRLYSKYAKAMEKYLIMFIFDFAEQESNV
jgi:hypothetical protein